MLAMPKVGPGLTFIDIETLTLRLSFLGFGDASTVRTLLATLGIGSVLTPEGLEYIHWEGALIALMTAMTEGTRISARDIGSDRVRTMPAPWFQARKPTSTETVTLCLIMDRAFDGALEPADMAARVVETRRLLHDIDRALTETNYGLGTARA